MNHKQSVWIVIFLILAVTGMSGASNQATDTRGIEYMPGEILVKLAPATGGSPERVREILEQRVPVTCRSMTRLNPCHPALKTICKLRFDGDIDVPAVCAVLNGAPGVVYAEPNMIARPQAVPNDPYYSSSGAWGQDYADMWAVHAINVEDAWDLSQGAGAVVAVIDTGVDYDHEDWFRDDNVNGTLDPGEQYNIWINAGEDLNGNGIADPADLDGLDSDGNGYVDDIRGYDMVYGDMEPTDLHGHGSHCAGIIAAVADNGIGITGVAPMAKVMVVKSLDDTGSGTADQIAEGFMYAADNGADIISNSWLSGFSQTIADAIDYARQNGCVVVAAAGNEAGSAVLRLPARHPGVITAAGINPDMEPAYFTNYGSVVDVCAPAVDVLSIRAEGTDFWNDGNHFVPHNDPNAKYYRHTGTSAACPLTCGVVALLEYHSCGSLDDTQIRRILTRSASEIPWDEHYIGTGLLDAVEALNLAGTITGAAAEITAPANDLEVISGQVPLEIYGTAAGDSYELSVGEGYYPDTWTTLATGGPVTNGLLGTLDLTPYTGPCRLRLRISDGTMTGDEHMVFYVEHSLPPEFPVVLGGDMVNLGGYTLSATYTSTLSDADGDGAEEIFIGSSGETFALNGDGSILPGWPSEQLDPLSYFTNGSMPGPSVCDMTGSGSGDVLWTLRDYSYGPVEVHCFNGCSLDGAALPGFPMDAPDQSSNAHDHAFVIGDIDGDDAMDAVAAFTLGNTAEYYRLRAFHADGSTLFHRDLETAGESVAALCFGDMEGTGMPGVVCVTTEAYQNADVNLRMLNSDGTDANGYPVTLYAMTGTEYVAGEPFLADLDGDGDLEIIAGISGSQGMIHAWHHDGAAVNGWPIQVGNANQLFEYCLGDMTGDGVPELIVLTNYRLESGIYRAYVMDIATGAVLAGWPVDVTATNRGVPAVADITGNGQAELLFVTDGGELHGYTVDGEPVTGYPKHMSYPSLSGVSTGDVDGDGLVEIVTSTISGNVYVWDTSGSFAVSGGGWSMRRFNARNTGVYGDWPEALSCGDTGVTIIMPSDHYHPGETCSCDLVICNGEDEVLTGYPLFVILDVYGMFFFAPSFGEFDYYDDTFEVGESTVQVLPAFDWPEGAGAAGPVAWYAAFTDPEITTLFGDMDMFQFQWSE